MWRALNRLKDEADASAAAMRRRGESPWLSSAKLKLVDGCNLRCFMCDYWQSRRNGELTTEEVLTVFEQLKGLGCEKVHLTGGELFLRRDVLALLDRAQALQMRTNLTTNGTLLDRETIRALVKLPVRSVTLSIDSPSSRTHDDVRGQRGAHAKTVRALDRLLETRRPKTRVRLNTVVSRRNYRTLVEMGEFLRDRAIDGWLLIPMDPWNDNEFAMRPEEIEDYNAHVAPVLAELVRIADFNPFVYGRSVTDVGHACQQKWARGYYRDNKCFVPWFHTLIDARGDVYPCCMSHTRLPALGNVRQQTLESIWNGEPYRAFRRAMTQERPAICHHCDDFLDENRALAALGPAAELP